jgi:hypothetical protein
MFFGESLTAFDVAGLLRLHRWRKGNNEPQHQRGCLQQHAAN